MALLSTKSLDRVRFYQDHIAPWQANATAIGTAVVEVDKLEDKTAAAREAYDAQRVAIQQARTATETYRAAVREMNRVGTGILGQIRARGEMTRDPNVYTLAQIPAPATPTPKGPPGTPVQLKVTLDGNGTLNLAWKCKNPRGTTGTVYQIYRRIGGTGSYTYLGGIGIKKFDDTSVPAGATELTYKIQAVRSTGVGQWATFNVNFGSNVAPVVTAVADNTSAGVRIAA